MAKWSETTASQCRYGDVAERVWGDWNILWEDSEADYQGHASFLAEKDGRYSFYEWWYGSCSGCDGWESDCASDDTVATTMRDTAIWFDDRAQLTTWLEMLERAARGEKVDHTGPGGLSNHNMERGGALAAGIDLLSGGLRGRINGVRAALGMPALA